jgi:hypothetical protein
MLRVLSARLFCVKGVLDWFWRCFGLFYNVHGFSRMHTDFVWGLGGRFK